MLSKQPSQQTTSNTLAPPGRPAPPHGQGSQTRPVRANPAGLLGNRRAQWGLRWRVQALLLAMLPWLACAQWKTARATWYDDAAWMSVHSGSCMYGYLGDRFGGNQNWMVAAINDGHMRYSGSCGRCYKIRCKPMAVRDNFGQQIDRNNECHNQDPITVVITDTCPCDKPNNAMSNKRWCCGDMDHFDIGVWAFRKFADPGKGVVGIEYQETPCTASFLQPLNPAVQKPSSLRGQYPFDLDSQHAAARAAASGVPAIEQKVVSFAGRPDGQAGQPSPASPSPSPPPSPWSPSPWLPSPPPSPSPGSPSPSPSPSPWSPGSPSPSPSPPSPPSPWSPFTFTFLSPSPSPLPWSPSPYSITPGAPSPYPFAPASPPFLIQAIQDATPDTRLATRPPPRPAPIGPISQQKVMEASGPSDTGRRRSG